MEISKKKGINKMKIKKEIKIKMKIEKKKIIIENINIAYD